MFDKLKYFKQGEFACRCCGREEMHPAFLLALDELREIYNRPMVITSGYRCPSYNKKVSSTGQGGPHTTGMAVDIQAYGVDAYELVAMAVAMRFSGIGISQKGPAHSRFIHLDKLAGELRPRIWSY